MGLESSPIELMSLRVYKTQLFTCPGTQAPTFVPGGLLSWPHTAPALASSASGYTSPASTQQHLTVLSGLSLAAGAHLAPIGAGRKCWGTDISQEQQLTHIWQEWAFRDPSTLESQVTSILHWCPQFSAGSGD